MSGYWEQKQLEQNFSGAKQTTGTMGTFSLEKVKQSVSTGATKLLNNVGESASRLGGAIAKGGRDALDSIKGQVLNIDMKSGGAQVLNADSDWRVRISLAPASSSYFKYSDSIFMSPLQETNGVIFPYTPQVSIAHSAKYGVESLTHSNYPIVFYQSSEVGAITINGEFTVQNMAEGRYLMAAVHFFRSCTKMFFGGDSIAGTPPPLVFLNGYGAPYLPNVPCVVTQFSHTMPSDVDYINVPMTRSTTTQPKYDWSGGPTEPITTIDKATVRLPTMSSLSVTLQPVYSRRNIYENFTLDKYAKGELTKGPTSNRGGFI